MTRNKDSVSEWGTILRQSEALRAHTHALVTSDNFLENLEKKLDTLDTQAETLFIILFSQWPFEAISMIYPIIVDISLDGNPTTMPLARSIVYRYCRSLEIKKTTLSLLEKRIDVEDYWVYGRMIELLLGIYDPVIMKKLLYVCRESKDSDIYSIYEEYNSIIDFDR